MLSICIAYSAHTVSKVNCGYWCARSVWLKVWPRRPFPGTPSVTPFSFRRPPSVTPFNFSVTLASCTPLIFLSMAIRFGWFNWLVLIYSKWTQTDVLRDSLWLAWLPSLVFDQIPLLLAKAASSFFSHFPFLTQNGPVDGKIKNEKSSLLREAVEPH